MKGSAHITDNEITSAARLVQSVSSGAAVVNDRIRSAKGRMEKGGAGSAFATGGITSAIAHITEQTNVRKKYLYVEPVAPQMVQWVRLEDVLTYTITSNTNWNIQ